MALNVDDLRSIAQQFNHAKVRAEAGIATADTLLALIKSLLSPDKEPRLFIPDGTLQAPGLAFEGNTGEGIYRDGDSWHLVSQGDEFITLNAPGTNATAFPASSVSIRGDFVSDDHLSALVSLLDVTGSLEPTDALAGATTVSGLRVAPQGITTNPNAALQHPVVASASFVEPQITIDTTGIDVATVVEIGAAPTEGALNYSLVVGGDVRVDGDFTEAMVVNSAGPHSWGEVVASPSAAFRIGGAYTTTGAGTVSDAVRITTDLTLRDGNTTWAALFGVGQHTGATVTTQGNSETIARVVTAYFSEPNITVGSGDTVTMAATVYIQSAPTEGSDNYALFVDAGDSRFDGDVILRNTGQQLFIGDTANADQATGITINAGTNNDPVFALKRTDVAHGLVSVTETDTCFNVGTLGAQGGVSIAAVAEDDTNQQNVMQYTTYGGEGSSAKTTSAQGLHWMISIEHNGSDSLANVTANGNVFAVSAQVGGVLRTIWILDEDGDYHYDGADGGAFDDEDDAMLVRALARATSKDTVRDHFDELVRYNEDDLVRLGVLGAPVAAGGLVNGAQLQRLHTGAIWQLHTTIQKQRDRIADLEKRLLE